MITVNEIIRNKFSNIRPLKYIRENGENIRFNIVTDSIGPESLFGGVATALILGTLICAKNGWTLRIITRNQECDLGCYYDLLELQSMLPPEKVESYSDYIQDGKIFVHMLPVTKGDIFLATSWWTAQSIIASNMVKRLFYIIQEEESFFYPYGDDHLMASNLMHRDDIDFIINSELLYTYMTNNGYDNIANNGIFFEPAFPEALFYPEFDRIERKDRKKVLFFYGRPLNLRNLFYLGIQCLDYAIERGILDTDCWDIYIAGKDIEDFCFSNGYVPQINGRMTWGDYAELARSVDVAFTLMYTPHPSYPPFDMLCSGAVVVTNEFMNKKELSYSDNMILKPLNINDLVKGIDDGIRLSENMRQRKDNYNRQRICRSWETSFEQVIKHIEEKIGDYYRV